MSYYKADRIERKNKRKAVVITSLLYLGVFAFFMAKDGTNWKEYVPFFDKIATEEVQNKASEMASREEIRP